ncbi:hypothetical protein TNCV_3269821 [Trichonephila clavipes]|uniref:Mos1 transposase HTH domain-containing protein n=1 Tax=Trichonephila clavipes TaxID=2585209 RepID=A0A8X6S5Q3_TRICX|nr:hypothetical protein TNCV_3269821 [Trichonephila clavipes]
MENIQKAEKQINAYDYRIRHPKPGDTRDVYMKQMMEAMAVKNLLTAGNMSAADIHRQITEIYGTETMRDNKVRKWVMKFKDGRTNVYDE